MMARLPTLKPALTATRSAIPTARDEVVRTKTRMADVTWRGLYDKTAWRGTRANQGRDGLRWRILIRDLLTCQWCGLQEVNTSKLVADHIKPHEGNEALFYDEANLQCLCKPCHDGKKQALDKANQAASYHPEWLEPSLIPLTILCGPPASGKSHYVRHHAKRDALIIDLDVIASRISGEPMHGWDRKWLSAALWQRNHMLGGLSKEPKHSEAWLIVSEPRARWREWWHQKMKPRQIVVIEANERQCVSNAMQDDDRDQTRVMDVATQWWAKYERRIGETRVMGGFA